MAKENAKQPELSLIKIAPEMEAVAKQLNETTLSVFSATQLEGFEKAYLVSNAIQKLQDLLAPEYMKPIMALQGNRLGFKTDKDDKGGYDEATVKNCLIEAVLTGVQPVGNQFNIITGNSYITKEGFGYLLKNLPGLVYEITPELPRINNDKSGAAIIMNLAWKLNQESEAFNTKRLDIPVKMNQYMGVDAVIGKATRKARAWLFNTITGSEISDGDITDVPDKRREAITGNETRSAALSAQAEEALKNAGAKGANGGATGTPPGATKP